MERLLVNSNVSFFMLAKPSFKSASLGPRNINVTEGEDAVFNCNAEAIPETNVVWMQNGNVLDGVLNISSVPNLTLHNNYFAYYRKLLQII